MRQIFLFVRFLLHFWSFEPMDRREAGDEVAQYSSIDGFRFVFVFFSHNFVTSPGFFFLQMPISACLGGALGPFLHRHGRVTMKKFADKNNRKLWPLWFFLREHIEIWSFARRVCILWRVLLVTHWSNELLPFLCSRSWLKLTMPKIFRCRKLLAAKKMAKKIEKNCSIKGQLLYFSTFLGLCWLNDAVYSIDQQELVLLNNICPNFSVFFSDEF